MEMRTWEQPLATVEKFIANEYVAACWGVKCDVVGDDPVKADGVTHRAQFCGDPEHYQIHLNDSNIPDSMTEIKTDNLGDLPCTLYTDESYSTVKDISTVKATDYIYWTTSSGNRTWHHHGPVSGTTNHS